jgi:hypothetical protein
MSGKYSIVKMSGKYSIVKMPGLQNPSTNHPMHNHHALELAKATNMPCRHELPGGRRIVDPSLGAKHQTPEPWEMRLAGRDRDVLEIESDLFRREAWAKGKQAELERKRRMTIRAKMWAAVWLALDPGP